MNARIRAIAALLVLEVFRKKDFYVALVLTVLLLGYAAQLRFFGVSTASRYLVDLGLVLGFFFGVLLTVSLAARQFPGELRDRTLQVLLARPVTRTEYLLGKFWGSWLAGCAVSFVFFAVVTAAALAKSASFSWVLAGETFLLFALGLSMLTALALALSIVLTPASVVSICVSAYALINLYGFYWGEKASQLPAVPRLLSRALYFAVPHFELFDLRQRFVHEWPAVPLTVVGFLALYSLFYTALFLGVGRWLLGRKVLS